MINVVIASKSLKAQMTKAHKTQQRATEPVWKGPIEEGITFSMINKFLTCRERARLAWIEGLKTEDTFRAKIEYGHMWHVCEEAVSGKQDWVGPLKTYYEGLITKYKHLNQSEEINKWYNVCKVQFPIYQGYWAKHKDNQHRTPLFQEYTFNVPYKLPSGRTVKLRGKIDAADFIGDMKKDAAIYVQENKTKGDIDEEKIKQQLTFDAQTGLYLSALHKLKERNDPVGDKLPKEFYKYPIAGVRYNVIRRPLSGGRGNIVQKKGSKNVAPETKEEFFNRLSSIIDGTGKNSKGDDQPGPSYFFMRWQSEFGKADVENYERRFLYPILEQICDWYDHVSNCYRKNVSPFSLHCLNPNAQGDCTSYDIGIHWQHPFGVTNMIDEGYSHDLDEHLRTGSMVGLRRVDKLFEELT